MPTKNYVFKDRDEIITVIQQHLTTEQAILNMYRDEYSNSKSSYHLVEVEKHVAVIAELESILKILEWKY